MSELNYPKKLLHVTSSSCNYQENTRKTNNIQSLTIFLSPASIAASAGTSRHEKRRTHATGLHMILSTLLIHFEHKDTNPRREWGMRTVGRDGRRHVTGPLQHHVAECCMVIAQVIIRLITISKTWGCCCPGPRATHYSTIFKQL